MMKSDAVDRCGCSALFRTKHVSRNVDQRRTGTNIQDLSNLHAMYSILRRLLDLQLEFQLRTLLP